MQRAPCLPFLPGYVFSENVGKTRFPRDGHFEVNRNIPMLKDKEKSVKLYPSLYARGETTELPPWLAFDKHVLKFEAYFQETMQEVPRSPFQIREVKILFFLEDGTVQIHEPAIENSGMSGGTLVRRQRIPFPPPRHHYFYDIVDFNIGKEIQIFGRIYKITNCDRFTRIFLNRIGIAVPDPINIPEDPYKKMRSFEKALRLPRKPKVRHDTLGPFLKYDRQVLRFWGYWDDRDSEYGILHKLEIHYSLSDGTIEIKDILPPNSGRPTGGMFLKKMKLPKVFKGIPGIGQTTPISLLNVLGDSTGRVRYVEDALNCGDANTEFYTDKDLCIGGVLNVFGRKVVLTDCDSFTKEFYRVKYGIDDFTPAPMPPEEPTCIESEKRELPPWNGFGTHADSEINCRKIFVQPSNESTKNFLLKSPDGLNSLVLRFSARLISKIEEDLDRYFIVKYFLSDNTMSIFELACRNSGFTGGKFLRRMAVPLPNQEKFSAERPKLYEPQHLYVGAEIDVFGYKFKLTGADEYCFKYMELHKEEFPKSDINLIMHKIREELRPIYRDFVKEHIPKTGEPIIPLETLRYALCRNMKEPLTDHEMIVIARNFAPPCLYERFSRNEIRQIVLTELKRGLWNDLQRFKEYLQQMDPENTGRVPQFECYNLIRAAKLPLDVEVINYMLKFICKDEHGNIIYQDLVNFLNPSYEPLPDVPPENYKRKLSWLSEREPRLSQNVDWCLFSKALNLEECIPLPSGDESEVLK